MKATAGSILLILIVIFQFSGSDLLFHVQRSQIRREIKTRIKEGVPRDEQEVFRLSLVQAEKLQWHNDHEFRYNGQMFDVVREERTTDSLTLYCINDHQETILFTRLDELTKQRQNDGPAREQQQRISLALSSFYLPAAEMNLALHLTALQKGSNPYFFKLKTWSKPPISPPPRLVS